MPCAQLAEAPMPNPSINTTAAMAVDLNVQMDCKLRFMIKKHQKIKYE
jgi:hypothetical protein